LDRIQRQPPAPLPLHCLPLRLRLRMPVGLLRLRRPLLSIVPFLKLPFINQRE
jgi:hypothetical protein